MKKVNKNIYAVCYYYPPLNSSEGFSAFKLLDNSSFEMKIYSQKDNTSWSYSSDEINSKQEIYYFDSSKWAESVISELNNKSIDILITRSMPEWSHKIALKLKKKKNFKWVCFFSDPLFFKSPISKWEHYYNLKKLLKNKKIFLIFLKQAYYIKKKISSYIYWKKIKNNADVIVFNNIFQANFFNSPKSKTKILPHCFLENESCNVRKNKEIVFSYIGNITRCRNLDFFIQAINKINRIDKIKTKPIFKFIGVDSRELKNIIKSDNVVIIEKMSYLESLLEMKKSDWLINSDANIEKYVRDYIYLPCKIIDYFSNSSNVINITNFKSGATFEITKKLGGINVLNDVDEIYNCIISILNGEINSRKKPSSLIEEYNSKNIVKKFDKIIEEL